MEYKWLKQLPIGEVMHWQRISGGDINEAYEIDTMDRTYFLLVQPNTTADFYDHEIDGLNLLGAVVNAPQVLAHGQIDSDAYLLISFIETGTGDQYQLGQMVAQLHQRESPNGAYGYQAAYTSGDFLVRNTWSNDWADFFLTTRLQPLAKRLQEKNLFLPEWTEAFARCQETFKTLIDAYTPAPVLLHGDLWAGNFLFDKKGTPYLIDPSVFYGDREFDIAVTTVFGGYNDRFYQGYRDAYPLQTGYQERMQFYKLYYLMIHVSLFGQTYQPSVTHLLKQY